MFLSLLFLSNSDEQIWKGSPREIKMTNEIMGDSWMKLHFLFISFCSTIYLTECVYEQVSLLFSFYFYSHFMNLSLLALENLFFRLCHSPIFSLLSLYVSFFLVRTISIQNINLKADFLFFHCHILRLLHMSLSFSFFGGVIKDTCHYYLYRRIFIL